MTTAPRSSGTPVLRALNTARVLRELRSTAPSALRITDLAEATGLTRPTITQSLTDLLAKRLVLEEPEERGSGTLGRPAQVYRLDPLALPVLGVDIGVHSVTAAVADASGSVLALERRAVSRLRVQSMVSSLDTAIETVVAESGISHAQVAAITVATPGIIDPTTDAIQLIPSISGWSTFNVAQHLRRRFGCPIDIENDANASAVAIAATSDPSDRPLLVVHWGERVGAGIVMESGLHHGAFHAAGEVGLIEVTPPADLGTARSHLQDIISTTAIGSLAAAVAADQPSSTLARLVGGATQADLAGTLFAAADAGDRTALELVNSLVDVFCAAVSPVVLALDPKSVVLSGGITRAGSLLADTVSQRLATLTVTRPEVRLSPDSENTVVKGAVLLAMNAAWRVQQQPPHLSDAATSG